MYFVVRCLRKGLRRRLKGRAKKRERREELHNTSRKVKVEAFDGRMEQENSSALAYNIEEKGAH